MNGKKKLTTVAGAPVPDNQNVLTARSNFRQDDSNYYTQPGKLFRLMNPAQQQALFENTARAMGDAPLEVKMRHIDNCMKADLAYGQGVADALGISLGEVTK